MNTLPCTPIPSHNLQIAPPKPHLFFAAALAILLTISATAEVAGLAPPRAVRVGDTLYISGTVNRNPETGAQPTDVAGSTRQVMANLKEVLARDGFTLADVVASEVWVDDLAKYAEMNNTYREAFSGVYPTRTTVEAAALPEGSPVQIAMVAVKGSRRIVHPRGAKSLGLPFSPGIQIGDKLYMSGQAGVDPATGKLVVGDFKTHVAQTLRNIGAVLESAEMNFSQVVLTHVFLTNPDDFGPMSEVYRTFTSEPRPARVPFGARKLPLNSAVEITMLASTQKGKPILPAGMPPSENYSRGYLVGNELYVSGIGSPKENVAERVDDCMDRVKKIFGTAGLSMDHAVMARIYLTDIRELEAVTRLYLKHFPKGKAPSQAIVAVPSLPGGLRMMISVVATKDRH